MQVHCSYQNFINNDFFSGKLGLVVALLRRTATTGVGAREVSQGATVREVGLAKYLLSINRNNIWWFGLSRVRRVGHIIEGGGLLGR